MKKELIIVGTFLMLTQIGFAESWMEPSTAYPGNVGDLPNIMDVAESAPIQPGQPIQRRFSNQEVTQFIDMTGQLDADNTIFRATVSVNGTLNAKYSSFDKDCNVEGALNAQNSHFLGALSVNNGNASIRGSNVDGTFTFIGGNLTIGNSSINTLNIEEGTDTTVSISEFSHVVSINVSASIKEIAIENSVVYKIKFTEGQGKVILRGSATIGIIENGQIVLGQ